MLQTWGSAHYRERAGRWHDVRAKLQDPAVDRTLLDIWLRERNRAFAIETGQIEGLYTLRRGVTEQLIAEGFEGVRAVHAVEPGLSDETLRGLLQDQHDAIELVFEAASGQRPLTHHSLKSWHQLPTRHQEYAPGVRDGRRVRIPLRRGDYKVRPNNPRRFDGFVHEYCPPEQTRSEMDRLLEMHHSATADRGLPTDVEAAWLHHELRPHPPLPGRQRPHGAAADGLRLRPQPRVSARHLARSAGTLHPEPGGSGPRATSARSSSSSPRSRRRTPRAPFSRPTPRCGANTERRHGNGGVTARDRDGTWRYHPPDMSPRELLILEGRATAAPGEHLPANVRVARRA